MDKKFDYGYIPKDMISGRVVRDEKELNVLGVGRAPFIEFEVLGDTATIDDETKFSEIFKVIKNEDGTIFISNRSYVIDGADREVPRALLVTEKGAELMKKNVGLLKSIDRGDLDERKPGTINFGEKDNSHKGYSGTTTIVDLPSGESIAIKRFNRYQTDGKRLPVGGLEVARMKFAIDRGPMKGKIRHPDIYFASQDVLVMENIEDLTPAMEAEDKYPDLAKEIRAIRVELNATMYKTFDDLGMVGNIDSMINRHLYLDKDSVPGKNGLVWIDPLV